MKIRMRGNSIRLRLTQGETARLNKIGLVEEMVEFGDGNRFVYAVSSQAKPNQNLAEYADGKITVFIQPDKVKVWAESEEEVTIEQVQKIGNGKTLRLLVEKDFACLKPRTGKDEDLDAFPHPLSNQKC